MQQLLFIAQKPVAAGVNGSGFNTDALQLQQQGMAGQVEQAPWRATLDTQGVLQLGQARQPDVDTGRLELSRLKLQAVDSARTDRTVEWTLESAAALNLQWQGARSGALQVQADPGQLRLQPVFRRRAAAPVTPLAATALPEALTPSSLNE